MGYITAIRAFFSGALGKLALVGLAVALLAGTVYYIIDLNTQLTTAQDEAKDWKKKFEGVDLTVKTTDDEQKKVTETFTGIDAKSVDLLCMARYGNLLPNFNQSPVVPAEPQIKEVIKYVASKPLVSPVIPATTPLTPSDLTAKNSQALSDEIRVSVLNNSWKAYCAVTGNKDDTCAPFR
jgi:hypothetical protein